MLDQINPGSQVRVKVVKEPTNAAAVKTIQRLLHRDATVREEHSRLEKVRKANFRTIRRGGRHWPVHVPKQFPVKGQVGEEGQITATVDALRDLGSVQRFVEVTPA